MTTLMIFFKYLFNIVWEIQFWTKSSFQNNHFNPNLSSASTKILPTLKPFSFQVTLVHTPPPKTSWQQSKPPFFTNYSPPENPPSWTPFPPLSNQSLRVLLQSRIQPHPAILGAVWARPNKITRFMSHILRFIYILYNTPRKRTALACGNSGLLLWLTAGHRAGMIVPPSSALLLPHRSCTRALVPGEPLRAELHQHGPG